MSLTVDFNAQIVYSSASITDVVAFHMALRDIEDNPDAMLHPVIHTYKAVDLGSGAIFPAVAFINGWTLQFPAGNYEIRGGNVSATINPVDGCYVKYTASAAYSVTSIGAGGATPTDIAAAVLAALNANYIPTDVRKVNGALITGNGRTGTEWGPA